MAKNGLLSEYRRDHGKDIPFVMSDVAEIERILPPLPKEGPYPPRAFNTVEDLIDTDPLLARRYVQGLVEEGYLVRVPTTGEGDASGSTATAWRHIELSSDSDIVLPQELLWEGPYAYENVKKLPTEPTLADVKEALKAPRYVVPPKAKVVAKSTSTAAAAAATTAPTASSSTDTQGRVLVPNTQVTRQPAPAVPQGTAPRQPDAPQPSAPQVVPSTFPEEPSQVPMTQANDDLITAQTGTRAGPALKTPDELRALYSSIVWKRVKLVTNRLLVEVADALPFPTHCTSHMSKTISFARLRLFWHRLLHTGIFPDALLAYLRNDDADRFAWELNSSWDEFTLLMKGGAWDWDTEMGTSLSRLEADRWEGVHYPEDADVAWMPTIGPTGARKDVTAAVNDPMDVDDLFAPTAGDLPGPASGQDEDADVIGQLPEGIYIYIFIFGP